MVVPPLPTLLAYSSFEHLSNLRPFSHSKFIYQMDQKPSQTYKAIILLFEKK